MILKVFLKRKILGDYIGGIFGQYFWKELEGDYSENIWVVFLERIRG
jgi:hypothetical protein